MEHNKSRKQVYSNTKNAINSRLKSRSPHFPLFFQRNMATQMCHGTVSIRRYSYLLNAVRRL